ncbi:hypothetical protein E1N52_43575 [Paraburkholderia guartelaensis]|uniref:Uncharacterized protein n=1 Tax=Paraburkholderia guartelaensis TaxID=2546446 RepID=A0A4R5KI14_9BURK|nr:hypothetical protein [Paraburkholderia guartelaensis]TDF95016.1 hypothetical protein E1N52_43575 [Paraburkholderia guartelaensis]
MSKEEKSAFEEADLGLCAVEKVIKLLKPLFGIAIPDFKEAARGFEESAKGYSTPMKALLGGLQSSGTSISPIRRLIKSLGNWRQNTKR